MVVVFAVVVVFVVVVGCRDFGLFSLLLLWSLALHSAHVCTQSASRLVGSSSSSGHILMVYIFFLGLGFLHTLQGGCVKALFSVGVMSEISLAWPVAEPTENLDDTDIPSPASESSTS